MLKEKLLLALTTFMVTAQSWGWSDKAYQDAMSDLGGGNKSSSALLITGLLATAIMFFVARNEVENKHESKAWYLLPAGTLLLFLIATGLG